MLNVCICDDDPCDITQIQALAESFAGEHPEFPLKIQTFTSPFDLLDHLSSHGGFDLYLLDILMPHMQGLEVAQRVRARNEAAEILFLTSSPEFALEAFDVAACGYLLKPLDKEKFDRALRGAAGRLTQPENPYLPLKTRDGMRKILFRDLVVVESFNHDRVCTLADGSRVVTGDTIASLMERLSQDARFFAPHRAYIINLEHIAALNSASVLLSTGQQVPVSRSSFTALKKAYMSYIF